MLSLFLLFVTLNYEARYWLSFPAMSEVKSISFSKRAIYLTVPDGVYILDYDRYRPIRTLTAADGITDRIKFCAYNPAQNELLIVTTDSRIFYYLPATGQVLQLNHPFKEIRSIGITRNGALIETESGLFQKMGTTERFQPVRSVPESITWSGQRDTTSARNFPFLTPYFVVDKQLNNYPLTRVWVNRFNNRLFALAENYGIVVYNLRSGLKEAEIRLGPPKNAVHRILEFQGHYWLLGEDQAVSFDVSGTWRYFPYRPGTIATSPWQTYTATLLELNRTDNINTLFPFDEKRLLIGTGNGLYEIDTAGKLDLRLQVNHPVNAIARIKDSIVVATDNGLFLLTDSNLTRITDPFARSDWGVFAIAQNREKTFFGTLGGILELDATNTWTHHVPPGIDLAQPVQALAATEGFLFVGTRNGIAIQNLRNRAWTTIDRSTGLAATNITALYADNRYLWIAAPGLISRYEYRRQLR